MLLFHLIHGGAARHRSKEIARTLKWALWPNPGPGAGQGWWEAEAATDPATESNGPSQVGRRLIKATEDLNGIREKAFPYPTSATTSAPLIVWLQLWLRIGLPEDVNLGIERECS